MLHTHTTLSHTIFHTQLCHTPSFTHNLVTHNLVTHHGPAFCVARVPLMALGWVWWRAWSPLVARGALVLCVAGVALAHIYFRFAWQAWRLAISTCVWHGRHGTWGTGLPLVARLVAVSRPGCRRRGTCSHPPSFCMAGVALVALGWVWSRAWLPFVARGAAALCVAGVALGDIDVPFA